MAHFDALLRDIGLNLDLAKSSPLDTTDDDAAIAAAAGKGDGELHPSDAAILKLFREVSAVLQSQGQAIRALQAALKGGGGGAPMRKALRADKDQGDGEAFLAKCLAAQSEGRIRGVDVATVEACINGGKSPPAEIVQRVLEGA